MKMNIEHAFRIIDKVRNKFPFQEIDFLYNHKPDSRITEKIIFNLKNFNNEDVMLSSDGYFSHTPLWYSIVAENHICKELLDPIIGIFSYDNGDEDDWDYLFEQCQYLICKIAMSYPEHTHSKVMDALEELIEQNSNAPYNYMIEVYRFGDASPYYDRILKLFDRNDFDSSVFLGDILGQLHIPGGDELIRRKIDEIKLSRLKSVLKSDNDEQNVIAGVEKFDDFELVDESDDEPDKNTVLRIVAKNESESDDLAENNEVVDKDEDRDEEDDGEDEEDEEEDWDEKVDGEDEEDEDEDWDEEDDGEDEEDEEEDWDEEDDGEDEEDEEEDWDEKDDGEDEEDEDEDWDEEEDEISDFDFQQFHLTNLEYDLSLYQENTSDPTYYETRPNWKETYKNFDNNYFFDVINHEKMEDRVKIGRNDSCPCGSGKKFKKCCIGLGIYD